MNEKCPYSEFFWCLFSCIGTEYGGILRISPYSVQMWENTDQKYSEYGHFLRSTMFVEILTMKKHLLEILLMSYHGNGHIELFKRKILLAVVNV